MKKLQFITMKVLFCLNETGFIVENQSTLCCSGFGAMLFLPWGPTQLTPTANW